MVNVYAAILDISSPISHRQAFVCTLKVIDHTQYIKAPASEKHKSSSVSFYTDFKQKKDKGDDRTTLVMMAKHE